ncbi:MAG: oligoendopeptidase F [Muribaculaceae bacterium]|nr:oligoendopeptidase F [Roseburia sp.]MCM1431800.1 oligoendopeptidase F [Muribaculaceae bacterium]MCM1493481.1 oligoendopeptidase F [Muribaculaceae bacterium]
MAEKTVKKRSEVAEEYKWRLEDLFSSDEDWEAESRLVETLAAEVKVYEGRLGESAGSLLSFMKKQDELNLHLLRVYVYANERWHEDTAVSKYQGYASLSDTLMVTAGSAASFAAPELLGLEEERLAEFYRQEPELAKYRRAIDEILRGRPHTLSAAEERILAEAGELSTAPSNIYDMFNDADLKFPFLTDEEGNTVQLTHGNYIRFLCSKNRDVRRQAFNDMYDTYARYGNTIAATFLAHLKQESFYARMRRFPGVRAMHLDSGNVPESVYDNLIETVHRHLPAMHRYMAVRKKVLGVDELHMYDLFAPLAEQAEDHYSYAEAKETVAKALEPMGEEYVSILREGYDNGWIDVYENENKRSGAYSWGAYGTHPYVLLNHQDDLESVFTLAHEMGHAIHTYYSNKNQPVTYAEYLIFVAEVASTCNEALLNHYLLENETDGKKRRFLTAHYLDAFRTTLFRQTMFAEFEMIVHKKLAEGEALTKEDFNRIYHDLNVLYYGSDMVVDERIDWEWMRIPHFYTSFYVYQYATGFSAAIAFSKKILTEGQPAVERYVKNFLSGGCSKDPIDLLAAAGVDMRTPKPIDDALGVFEEYLDMFEQMTA